MSDTDAAPVYDGVECDGEAHAWELLSYQPGEPQRAIAKCCGVTATYVRGSWHVDELGHDLKPFRA